MNMLPVLARAFGVDPDAFERQVEAYENREGLTEDDALILFGNGRPCSLGTIHAAERRAAALEAQVRELEAEARSWRSPQQILRLDAEARVAELEAENARFQATLDGDPSQAATPEQRRAWRQSAVRYADKLEAENRRLREVFTGLLRSHAWYTDREYKRDPTYNNQSPGYKEEEAALLVFIDLYGQDALSALSPQAGPGAEGPKEVPGLLRGGYKPHKPHASGSEEGSRE